MPAFFSHVEISRRADARAPSDGSTLEGRPNLGRAALARPPRHTWSLEQRAALCVLKRWFSPSFKEIHFVFNAHYASSINEQNPGHKIGRNALLAQLHHMEDQGEDNEAWRSVVLETEFGDPRGCYENTRQDLEATATEIGIALVRGWEDKQRVSTRSGRGRLSKTRKRKRGGSVEGVLGFVVDYSEEEEPCRRPKRRYGLLTPPTSPRKSGQATQTHQTPKRKPQAGGPSIDKCAKPLRTRSILPGREDYNHRFIPPDLGFRFWDNNSHGINTAEGFRAGAFVNCHRNIPSPPNRNSQVFRDQTNIHLQPLPEPSSYISVWQGILPAFHRGLRSSANAHVAIINLRAVYDQQLSGIPGLYPAADAINQLKMVIKGNYRGIGDWLVWGEIKRAAVVACFTVDDFRRFIHSMPQIIPTLRLNEIEASTCADEYQRRLRKSQLPISRASGKIVGRFLAFTSLPKSFVNFAARKVALSWQFLGLDNAQRYKAYLDGVYDGFDLRLATMDNALHIVPNHTSSITASAEGREPGDAFEVRRAAIQFIIAGSHVGTDDSCVQVWRRQIDATAGTSEAETEIDAFLVQRRRIESIFQASNTH